MRASTIMLVAVLLYLVHRWATNQKTVDPKTVVEVAFAVLVIALLDQGETEPVAKRVRVAVPRRRRIHGPADDRQGGRHRQWQARRAKMMDKADIKTGFWIAVGVLLALFAWSFVQGGLGKLRSAA